MRLKDEDIKEIARLVDEGYSSGHIASKYNYPRQSMQCIIARYQKHGLKSFLSPHLCSLSIEYTIMTPATRIIDTIKTFIFVDIESFFIVMAPNYFIKF